MPTPPSPGFERSRLDPSTPEPDLTPRDPPCRPRQALAESRAASARDSPDAPRPLPSRPRPPPGGAVELGAVESDEAMARRLQREERERANASSRDAFYPNAPYDPARRARPPGDPRPSFLMPVPHPPSSPAFSFPPPPSSAPAPPPTAESTGRRAMNDEIARNTGKPEGTWTAPVLRGGSYPEPSRDDREPATPYRPGGGDADAALAARLQAEEDAAAAAGAGASSAGGSRSRSRAGGDVIGDDEALARALQEEEDRATGQTNAPRRRTTTTPASDSVPPGACPGCRRVVSAFEGYVTAMGARWHRGCFTCGACGGAIGGTHFATRDGAPFHRSCYREKFAPRCGVCDEFIGGTGGSRAANANEAGGSVRFMTHPYWGTAKVVQDLMTKPGWAEGKVVLPAGKKSAWEPEEKQ